MQSINCNLRLLSAALACALVFMAGCSQLFSLFETAPLEDGLFLAYEMDDSLLTIRFEREDGSRYNAVLQNQFTDPLPADYTPEPEITIVDSKLRKENGVIYQPAMLGPIWVAPTNLKAGGSAHGTYIDEITEWKGWDVAVVTASFGRGAVSGAWYYEQQTGFLVGGQLGTVMDASPMTFILVDTNLAALKR